MWRCFTASLSRSVSLMSSEPAAKIARTMTTIGTHDGTFHCDEVFACYMLTKLHEYKGATIIRTRDPSKLETCDIVVDVGGVFDPKRNRYDHHQRSFSETMKSLYPGKKWETKLSSAGLIYCHFGRKLLSQLLGCTEDSQILSVLYDKVYENFVEEVDAIDNGINQTDEKPRYIISTNISSRVANLNPRWNESSTPDSTMTRFYKAMKMVGEEFEDKIGYYRDSWWPAREIVEQAVAERFKVSASGQVIKFEKTGCPWKDHLFTLEEEKGLDPQIVFVLYPDDKGAWRVQCVPKHKNTFENRLSLLEQWRGVRDEDLSELSGIPGCIFVHATGFIGGNKTYEGALQMALTTLRNESA